MANLGFHSCDQCVARAKFTAAKAHQELFFCGHHFDRHYLKLTEQGWDTASLERPAKVPVMEGAQ